MYCLDLLVHDHGPERCTLLNAARPQARPRPPGGRRAGACAAGAGAAPPLALPSQAHSLRPVLILILILTTMMLCARRDEDPRMRGRARMRMLLTKGQVGAVMGRRGTTIK